MIKFMGRISENLGEGKRLMLWDYQQSATTCARHALPR
jgi:hypothetical protein